MTKKELADLFLDDYSDNETIENMRVYLGNSRTVKFSVFYKKFKDVKEPIADEFKKVETRFGYGDFFDKCKEQGILK